MPKDLDALWKRQASKYEPPDAAIEDWHWPEPLSDEQLATLRSRIDETFGAGTADVLLEGFSGPMPDFVRDAIDQTPGGFPATSQDFAEAQEEMRRLLGDLRERPTRDHAPEKRPS